MAANGNAVAQEFLAHAYQEGWLGLIKDKEQARYWYQQAAKRSPASTN
jgi:TPR repeat protein